MNRLGSSDDGASVILGVSCDFHDAAAALVVDGAIAAAAEEERFTRCKHDDSAPASAIESCLRIAGLGPSDVDVIAFYERPVDVLTRFLAAKRRQGPVGFGSFVRDAPTLIGKNLMIAYRLERILRRLGGRRSPRFCYVDHHRSHAAAAFFPSPHRNAAVLTIDGIGEWATATVARGFDGRLDVLEEMRYPDSIGLLYSFVTAYCGFVSNSDEYKLMGLAPYGVARYVDALADLAQVYPDGSVEVRADRLGWYSRRGLHRAALRRAFDGPPTVVGAGATQRDADLAASVQHLLETAVLRLGQHARDVTGEDHLCLAGGVALNCVANSALTADGSFESIWIQPAAGDAGGALGAALSVWHEVLGSPRALDGADAMHGALLGPSVSTAEVLRWAVEGGIDHRQVGDRDTLCELVAERIDGGGVVGWFQGRMEFGPRALGNRSILADPRDPMMRERVNARVKGREGFRPFAPAVLEEHAGDWFELDGTSPYMLLVSPVAGAAVPGPASGALGFEARADLVQSPLPACTHIDGSARVQTIDRDSNPEFRRLVEAFHRRTGCPVVLNTSFNVAGEPIVCSPVDAFETARAAALDLLVIEDVVFERHAFRGEP